ncbi:hypothetical protein D7Y13_13115 [Corallococcus praedator]|uniref:Uncharacterized protein n=1 Tax=Corallococcus praedator TaxID=2316724 RepID=A0ABX9QJS2_9BACT|nr:MULTISPECIES: hypothetical protein [Corallococcus]RKH16145.1 hypothetical protein D7X74_16385 [Corallococcus sp. CA047B]RKH36002.1 hypothetical protein D7X75_02015 [Corallococcus sp. CA031C]RKI10160.1 hypothetical protein D7Y13_13115 [Corallococcus praedator]
MAPVSSERLALGPVRLSAQTPRVTKPFLIRVTAEQASKPLSGDFHVVVTAHWNPVNPAQTTGTWLRPSLTRDGATLNPGPSLPLTEPGTPVGHSLHEYFPPECELKDGQACEWRVNLDLEIAADAPPGTVDVKVDAVAQASARQEEAPRGFTVTLEAL